MSTGLAVTAYSDSQSYCWESLGQCLVCLMGCPLFILPGNSVPTSAPAGEVVYHLLGWRRLGYLRSIMGRVETGGGRPAGPLSRSDPAATWAECLPVKAVSHLSHRTCWVRSKSDVSMRV